MEKGNRGGRKYSFDLSLSRAPVLLTFAPPDVRENGVDIICINRIFLKCHDLPDFNGANLKAG